MSSFIILNFAHQYLFITHFDFFILHLSTKHLSSTRNSHMRKEGGWKLWHCNQYINPACQHTLDWWRLKWLACIWDCLPEINETFVKSVKHYTSYRFTDYHKEPINSKISSNTSFKFVHKQLINSKTYNTSCKLVDYTNNRWNKNNS